MAHFLIWPEVYKNKVSPYGDNWVSLYQGLRDCNIFLDNIGKVHDIDETERLRWISEVEISESVLSFLFGENVRTHPDIENQFTD